VRCVREKALGNWDYIQECLWIDGSLVIHGLGFCKGNPDNI
jgi:hypothetical protein